MIQQRFYTIHKKYKITSTGTAQEQDKQPQINGKQDSIKNAILTHKLTSVSM